jgi:putative flippase GtrA
MKASNGAGGAGLRNRSLRRKIASFALIGVMNTGIDAGAFAVFLAMQVPVLVANLMAWCCGVSFSFVMNARLTFVPTIGHAGWHAFLRFAATGAVVSLLCSTVILALLSDMIGIWPAKGLAIVIGAVLGFIAAQWSIEGTAGPGRSVVR